MKRTLLLCLVASLLWACGGDKPKKNKNTSPMDPPVITNNDEEEPKIVLTTEQQLQVDVNQKIEEELASKKRVDKLICGFEFGMNVKAMKRHADKMINRGNMRKINKKISKTKTKRIYLYKMPFGDKKNRKTIDTDLDTELKSGAITKVMGTMRTPRGQSTENTLQQTKDLFTEWYGAPAFELPNMNNCARYIWINGNRHIDLHCELQGVVFTYSDLTDELPSEFAPMPKNGDEDNNGENQIDVSDTDHRLK
ncbi:MAG: hypothetical protein MK212_17310 [Saprospiraceae bacterium]|nr:hypothetical protein [Saprospiraceae bacterium]